MPRIGGGTAIVDGAEVPIPAARGSKGHLFRAPASSIELRGPDGAVLLRIALDEPTSDLDPVHAARVETLILELRNKQEYGIVLSTHDLDLAARVANRVVILQAGSVIAEGPPRDLFYDRALLERSGLIEPGVVRIWRALRDNEDGGLDPRPITEHELVTTLERKYAGESRMIRDITDH